MEQSKASTEATIEPRMARTGAMVQYCGHDAMFIADVFEIGDAVAICAPTEIEKCLIRPAKDPTHHVVDFPHAGMWKPKRGMLVVERAQVKVLR